MMPITNTSTHIQYPASGHLDLQPSGISHDKDPLECVLETLLSLANNLASKGDVEGLKTG